MKKVTTWERTKKAVTAFLLFVSFSSISQAQYIVDFEGTGEESAAYPAETVSLSGLNWTVGPEVQIGTASNDFKNGSRSARLRGRDGSVLTMIQDKSNGIGTISFVYRSYGSDTDQQPWAVEYSTDQGISWIQAGSVFTATANVQTFQETINVSGNIRLRIRLTSTPGISGDRRVNVDDITITDYIAGAPVIATSNSSLTGFSYIEGGGPSSQQSVTLTGANLSGTGNIMITAPANFEVSADNITYGSTLSFPYDLGVITGTGTFYTRLVSGLTPGVRTGTITIEGGGATTVTVSATGVVQQTLYPSLYDFSNGAYSFTQWNATSPAYTSPDNMRFWVAGSDEAVLNEQPVASYEGAFNLTSASRINGLGSYGVSFLATGSAGAGFPLGAVLGINAQGKENIAVSWTGGLETQGAGVPLPRYYGLRLQYQIGQSAVWTDVPGPIEFLNANKTDGEFENFGPTVLPAGCNNQPEIYLRWIYYFIASNDGGSRPNLRLDNITVAADDIVDPSIQTSVTSLSVFNQTLGTPSAEQTFNVSGANLINDIVLSVSGDYEISTTSSSGFGSSLIISHTNGTVLNIPVYVRLNASSIGTKTGSITLSSQNAANVTIDLNGQTAEYVEEHLLYYWHFNNMTSEIDVTEIIADYSLLPEINGKFTYTDPITGERDIDLYNSGSSLNLQLGEAEGISARVRNPSATRSLVFDVPTTGTEGLKMRYAVQRSGQGMLYNIVEYSVDGTTFTSSGLSNNTQEVAGNEEWQLFTFDFTSISAVDDNPNFKIKITWDGNTTASNGNNRYDNITLTATTIDSIVSVVALPVTTDIKVFPVPFENVVNITSDSEIQGIQLFDALGRVVKSVSPANNIVQEIPTNDMKEGVYIFMIKTVNGTRQIKALKK